MPAPIEGIIDAGSGSVLGEETSQYFRSLEFEHPFLAVKRFECGSAPNGFLLATSEAFTQTVRGCARM